MPFIDRALIVDYRLFGAPLPRAEAFARHVPPRLQWPQLNIHVSLLDDHWSISGGHWSAELAARYERSQATRDRMVAEDAIGPAMA